MRRAAFTLFLGLVSAVVAIAATPSIRIEVASGGGIPSDLPAGNWTLHLPPETPLPRGGTIVVTDASGARITAPITRQIHFHVSAPLQAIEWTPAPPDGGFSLEPIPGYEPRIVLRHDRALLPLASATETEEIILTVDGDLPQDVLPSLPLLPFGAQLAVVTSWDDGHPSDLRAAELLRRHGYSGTFFMNEHSHARHRDLAALEALGMEIGSHTVTHPRGWTIAPDQWRAECLQMRLGLEATLGHPVVSFAYPYNHTPAYDIHGDYVLRAVRDTGYESGRTTRVKGETIEGYPEPLSFSTDGHFLMPADRMEQAWRRAAAAPGGVFYFWGHASEIRTPADWENFEAILARHAGRPEAWYATQGQLFLWRQVRAQARWERISSDSGTTTFKLTLPLIDTHWRSRIPISVRLPSGVPRITISGRSLPVAEGVATLQPRASARPESETNR